MANFKTHMGWGMIIGAASVVGASLGSLVYGWDHLFLIFGMVLIGSFLPDMDMDEGLPFQILFGLLSVGVSGYVFYDLYTSGQRDVLLLILIPMASFFGMRFFVGGIFMRFTDHRGIWHSVPAAILIGLIVLRVMQSGRIGDDLASKASMALMIGYVGHLILDEIYASVNLAGGSLLPKRSLGSALKLYARSKISTVIVYAGIVYLWFFC